MSRVPLIDPRNTTPDRREPLDQISAAFGLTPNMFRAVANSPAALTSMWGAFAALGGGVIPPELGEKIAVAIADHNRCEYCLAAHTLLGTRAGATAQQMTDAQAGRSDDPATAAALTFALKLVRQRAHLTPGDIDELRTAGFDDEQIVEIIAHTALNLFNNYINVALQVPLDFPGIRLTPVAA